MNVGWYREEPNKMIVKGSCKIVFDALQEILIAGNPPSISALANRTGYHENTVRRALRSLDETGLIRYRHTRPGMRSEYKILQSPD
jgi:DNA-binding transcriptional regulator YhcF (GntR family)